MAIDVTVDLNGGGIKCNDCEKAQRTIEELRERLMRWERTFDFDTFGIEAGWCGPCAHGRDPYTRCDECSSLDLPELVLKSVNSWSHSARTLERDRDALASKLAELDAKTAQS